jgi:hypothetical protein
VRVLLSLISVDQRRRRRSCRHPLPQQCVCPPRRAPPSSDRRQDEHIAPLSPAGSGQASCRLLPRFVLLMPPRWQTSAASRSRVWLPCGCARGLSFPGHHVALVPGGCCARSKAASRPHCASKLLRPSLLRFHWLGCRRFRRLRLIWLLLWLRLDRLWWLWLGLWRGWLGFLRLW